LTFPGVIEEPGCTCGSWISPRPSRGRPSQDVGEKHEGAGVPTGFDQVLQQDEGCPAIAESSTTARFDGRKATLFDTAKRPVRPDRGELDHAQRLDEGLWLL
jgi:hypothetical protein